MSLKNTWILVADAGQARILEPSSEGAGLRSVSGMNFHNDLPPTHELVDDGLARSFESAGTARHGIEPKTDPRRKEKRNFAQEIAERMQAELDRKSFQSLIVAAAPQWLGDFRAACSRHLREAITRELDKDLTKSSDADIAKAFDIAPRR
jgi:protein required for attachment to host cells